ncbi:MAG TPA: alpha/beta hydrolase fold domain-containing protein [Micropepsaceae bacterium]|nr:alpha/beta hydrolase fold domain-containing protein [Micropepsaceae bacterium]
MSHATPLAELRRYYDGLAAELGPVAGDVIVERAQLGQVKGEWVSIADTDPQRLVLYFHGGGYISGSPETYRALVAKLCRVGGAAALSLDYRLGPEFPFPACLRDAVDAYRFLIAKAYPPESVVLAGDGAGGGLAVATMMAIRNGGLPMPAGLIAMSPWADLTLSGWSIMQNADSDPLMSWDLLFVSARHYLKGANPADPYASPVYGSMRDFPPIMIHAGSREILRDDASRLGELAAEANVSVSVEVYDGMGYLFQAAASQDAKVSLHRLGQFIRARTPEAAPNLNLNKSAKRGA